MTEAANPLTGWAIDTSTGTPILTYEACSVIQDEQAHLVMRALTTLDALTRELAETKAAADASQAAFDTDLEAGRADLHATIAAQAERIKALEEENEALQDGPFSESIGAAMDAARARERERITRIIAQPNDICWINSDIHGVYADPRLIRAALAPKEVLG